MVPLSLALLLAGCGASELTVSPTLLSWGEIDFQEPRPEEGYLPQEITLRNDGSRDLDLRVEGFDDERLLLGALVVDDDPPTLPTLPPGSTHVITVAVWDYLDGERDTLVEGSFRIDADALREPATIRWDFTPVRHIIDTAE